MPSQRVSLGFLLRLLVFAAVWTSCHADPVPDASLLLDKSLSPPEPSPSPAPAHEGSDPLRDPKVRRALIRALTRSLQNLGGDKIEDPQVISAPQQSNTVRFHATLGTKTTTSFRTSPDTVKTTTERAPLLENNFLPRSILEQVNKQIEKAEFLRVHPDEVLVTSKTEPRPFSLKAFGNSYVDSFSTTTIEDGNSNSLSNDEVKTTTQPPTVPTESDLRIEQHEIKSFDPATTGTTDDSAMLQNQDVIGKSVQEDPSKASKPLESEGNSVDIYRAPLIAAFTVHQDYETGATRGVVPLLPVINQASTSSPLSSSIPQGNAQLPPHFPLPSDELQDLVRQITTHPGSSKSGRFPFSTQPELKPQRIFNSQLQRLPEKQNLIYFQGSQQGFSQGVQQNHQLGSRQEVQQGLPQVINSPNIPSVRGGEFLAEQHQLQQRFQRIQTLQELQQLQARLDRLQRQVQVG